MKLGLVLVLVVAALLPDLFESRTVTKCELKEKLQDKIYLPRKLRRHRDEVLSLIICEVSRKSSLSTSLVNVDGFRFSMTTALPTTEGMEPETEATTTTTTTAGPVSSMLTTAAGGSRKKRRASRRRHKSEESQESLNDMENKFDEEEMERDDERLSKESSSEEGGSSHPKITLWSLGYYGIFQLRDSLFCDSGYRWSKNLCGKSCTDFTDDDITDDIDCFVSTNYHWYIFRSISHQCFKQRKTFLQDCS
ncbi:PREDICTED: uncharacterized protein LOC106929585 [Poecilia mexicana]|uniref:uncharacterized protein LOC106929585 n=1 Tax=Poecilia mexicana TaxID=48701 RepID=UPI00072DB34F|nr:PREDICTED: uncharacterized protein LOC106929585 [Poecilia mexicana]